MLDALLEVPRARLDDHALLTQRRHLKELVRARMARTGESYATARAQLARRARAEVRGSPSLIVPVTDMDRATRFYTRAFGFQIRSASSTWTILGDDDGHGTLVLEPAAAVGVDLGIGITVVELPAALAAVVAAGGSIASYDSGPAARVFDPDGNVVRLMAVGVASS